MLWSGPLRCERVLCVRRGLLYNVAEWSNVRRGVHVVEARRAPDGSGIVGGGVAAEKRGCIEHRRTRKGGGRADVRRVVEWKGIIEARHASERGGHTEARHAIEGGGRAVAHCAGEGGGRAQVRIAGKAGGRAQARVAGEGGGRIRDGGHVCSVLCAGIRNSSQSFHVSQSAYNGTYRFTCLSL